MALHPNKMNLCNTMSPHQGYPGTQGQSHKVVNSGITRKSLSKGICLQYMNTVPCTDKKLQARLKRLFKQKEKTNRPKTICRQLFNPTA